MHRKIDFGQSVARSLAGQSIGMEIIQNIEK